MATKLKKTEAETTENSVTDADWGAKTGHAETDYLLSTPANVAALRESIKQLESGKGIEKKIDFS